jgi:CO/xanthine dehydrogenase FAD-binding subunit
MVVFHRRLPILEYVAPKSLKEALSFISRYGVRTKIFVGGTDLVPKLKRREIGTPEYLLDIKHIPDLDYINYNLESGLKIGAQASIRSIENSPVIREKFNVLFEAAGSMASVQVRNRGTIAGNICNAVPSADSAPALLTLDALLKLVSSQGERTVNINDFFTGPSTTVLKSDEIVTEIQIPSQPASARGRYIKLTPRSAMDLAVVGVAVQILADCGTCNEIRIALGAVSPTPMRAKKAENFLKGQGLTPDIIRKAAEIAGTECNPITDHRASKEYRCEMVEVLTKRAINDAIA